MTIEQFQRLRRVLRSGLARLDQLRFSGPIDEYFLTELRAAMRDAGATDEEMRALARFTISLIAQHIADPDELIQLVADHLLGVDMDVRITRDRRAFVTFPDPPSVH